MKQFNLVGVDVSESSIKVLQLGSDNTIVAYGSAPLALGLVEKGRIMDMEAFSTTLNDVLKKTKPKVLETEGVPLRAVLCLPESKLFSHHCIVPETVKEKELKEYIYADAQKIIPFELDTLYWNYHVATENGIRHTTFSGVAKQDLDNYMKAFTYAKVRPAFIGGELFSLGWALLPEPPLNEDYIIIDMGAHSTTIGIFGVDAVANLSILVPFGGEYFTQFLAERLGVTVEEAERLKQQYGVDPAHEETSVPAILRECLQKITDKVVEAKIYFEKKTGNSIEHIIVAGGSALLPQIQTFISEKTGTEARLADPFIKIKGHELFGSNTPGIFYANVIGLALCATRSDFSHLNLLTQYRDDDEVDGNKDVLSIREVRSIGDFYYVVHNFLRSGKKFMLSSIDFIKKLSVKMKVKLKLFATILILLLSGIFLFRITATYL